MDGKNDDKTGGSNNGDAKSLNSAEYRQRLLNKLNCLIAVLEVAIGKIAKSMDSDETNRDRLIRIKSNLENTLAICRRAKGTLETRLHDSAETTSTQTKNAELPAPSKPNPSFRCYVELSSIEEFRKFKSLPAITNDDIETADLDELTRRLFGDE